MSAPSALIAIPTMNESSTMSIAVNSRLARTYSLMISTMVSETAVHESESNVCAYSTLERKWYITAEMIPEIPPKKDAVIVKSVSMKSGMELKYFCKKFASSSRNPHATPVRICVLIENVLFRSMFIYPV